MSFFLSTRLALIVFVVVEHLLGIEQKREQQKQQTQKKSKKKESINNKNQQ